MEVPEGDILRGVEVQRESSVELAPPERTVGLVAATGIGVGAIVGGGILVLGGVALESTGPSAIIAFLLNGIVALMTAVSFAEMSTAFPESGGVYTFAQKVLSVRLAFAVGWVLWFAYIVAGVLYALGFAEYTAAAVNDLAIIAGMDPPPWLRTRATFLVLGILATIGYSLALIRSPGGGGQVETIGKMVIFSVLIAIGVFAVLRNEHGTVLSELTPFFANGFGGFLSAMGFTFIALQGFDLIAAVGGEVREPTRIIPRAMFYSLGIALVIYIPLLFLVSTVGSPGEPIAEMSARSPATVMADAARKFAGWPGYWMVVIGAILSTLSALSANMLAASHVALQMAKDRTLPHVLERSNAKGSPVMAVYTTALAAIAIMLMIPDVAAAGAAASLIFLVCFALVHWMSALARIRAPNPPPFRAPFFPIVPLVGGLACGGLAIFQAVAVPDAGVIALVWLGLGVILYMALFADRAQVVDAYREALNPQVAIMRAKRPLVLAPVSNPANAAKMALIANALATPVVGRAVLLNVVLTNRADDPQDSVAKRIGGVETVVREALGASLTSGHTPETLITIADNPWKEIARVVQTRDCECLVLGLSTASDVEGVKNLEELLNEVQCDVVLLCAKPEWRPTPKMKVVVPVGGRGGHDNLRARLLGSLNRAGYRNTRFVQIVPSTTGEREQKSTEARLLRFAREETYGKPEAVVTPSDNIVDALAGSAGADDLLVLGLQQHRGKRLFSEVALKVARQTEGATLMISRLAARSLADEFSAFGSHLPFRAGSLRPIGQVAKSPEVPATEEESPSVPASDEHVEPPRANT